MIQDNELRKTVLSYLVKYLDEAGKKYESELVFISERLNETLDGSKIEVDGKTLYYASNVVNSTGITLIYKTNDNLYDPVEIKLNSADDIINILSI